MKRSAQQKARSVASFDARRNFSSRDQTSFYAGSDMLPIPGTSSLAHLEENMAAEKLQLSAGEWRRIEALARS